jgi:WD40 repeat protein
MSDVPLEPAGQSARASTDTESPTAPTSARGRRRFRFGLRTLLVIVTLVCLWLGLRLHRDRISAHNVAVLEPLTSRAHDNLWKVAWNHDGSRAALVRFDKSVDICEGRSLLMLSTVGRGKKVVDFAFSPRDGVVALGLNSKTAEVFDTKTGQTIALNTGNDQPSLDFSPDGSLLATGGYGTHARTWNVATGQPIQSFDTRVPGGLTVVFSPDGKSLAVGNRNSTTWVFDVATGSTLFRLAKESSHQLAFDPRGDRLAVSYVDASVAIWDARTGRLLHMAKDSSEEVFVLDWSPDGKLLITAGLHGPITIWDAATMTVLHTLPTADAVFGVKFRPDQRTFITSEGGRNTNAPRMLREWGISLLGRLGFPSR